MIRPAFALAMLLLPAAALAESPDELIKRGVELRKSHQDEEALALFTEAHQAAPSPRTFGQMGFAEQALKRFVEAYAHVLAALAVPDDPWVKKNREALQDSKAALEREVGELILEAEGAVPTRIQVQGGPPVLPGTPIYAAKGKASVTVEAEGHAPLALSVDVKPGIKNRLRARFDSATPASAQATTGARTDEASDDGGALSTLGYVSLGLGAVGLTVMAIGLAVRSGPSDTLNGPFCFGDPFVCPNEASAVSSADAMIAVGAISGALLLGGGISLLILAPSGDGAVAELTVLPGGARVRF